MKARGHMAIAAAAGALAVGGFAPLSLFPLPMLSLAWLIHRWSLAANPAGAAMLGFSWGLGFFLAGVSWVYVSLHTMGGMAAPLAAAATLLFCGYLALFPALVGAGFSRLRGQSVWANVFLAAGLWTWAEMARGTVFTGFPWLSLGYSQTPPSPLAGYAPLVGSYGVGLVTAGVAAVLALAPRNSRAWLAIAAAIFTGALLRQIAWSVPLGEPARISLLQGNIPQSIKWDPRRLEQSVTAYVNLAREHPADLTVLPETAIPLFLDEIPPQIVRSIQGSGALLMGTAVLKPDGRYYNGVVAIARDGTQQRYFKRHLVPFGEFVPPGFAWFFRFVRIPLSNFSAGAADQPPLALAGQRIMPNICYEDLFGEEILAALPAATLLINVSNTAWFGDSLAQPQHLQIARMRALETARPMLRAANTGMTAAILPDGQVDAVLPAFTTDALTAVVRGYAGTTPYARWHNAPALALALLAVLPALAKRAGRRR